LLDAETTFASWAFWVSLQVCVAWWTFAPSNSPLPGVPRRVVPRLLGEARKRNIVATSKNSAEEPSQEECDEMVDDWVGNWLCFSLHHGIGGACMFLGMYLNRPALWRVGLTLETGEDILHFVQMALAGLLGIGPIMEWSRRRVILIAMHHTLGLVAGVPAYFLLSEWPDVQLFCFIMLGASVPGMALEGALATLDPEQPGMWTLHLVLAVFNFAMWICFRFVIFMPICFRVLPRVAAEHGTVLTAAMGTALLLFTLFNIFAAVWQVIGIHGMFASKMPEELHVARRISRTASSPETLLRSTSRGELADIDCAALMGRSLSGRAMDMWKAKEQ